MENLERGRLNQANGRLRAAKAGVAIVQRCDRLYLQATLPPKTDSGKVVSHQQQIALGIYASPAGISFAEKESRKLGVLLASKEFLWSLYVSKKECELETIANWIQKFEESKRQTVSVTTWKTDYARPFGLLPADQPITTETLLSAISRTKPNSRQRRRFCFAFRQLGQISGLEIDVKDLVGNYSPPTYLRFQFPLWFLKASNTKAFSSTLKAFGSGSLCQLYFIW
ncbi:hypothetical protein [Microcoleus sp. bin38.metabat.b11b12b14.051]|uniref:hypothetical protein n=1 Tax=Microcoleus sp. bin38.metabat.b11b12b14.051 TaxID=2742709 RepID=UPI0025EA3A5D|nr:hypothetical protein [Microcoleus sp. bin38.metabat.b11b12b14.051]